MARPRNAARIEQLLHYETTWPKHYGGRSTTEILGRDTRILAREVLRLRAQVADHSPMNPEGV